MGASGFPGVELGDEFGGEAFDGAGEAGAEEGVDDEPGLWGIGFEVGLGVDGGDVHFGDDGEVGFGVACDLFWGGGHDDGGAVVEVVEVAGEGEAVACVVAWACGDEDGLGAGCCEHVEGVIAEPDGGVFHQEDRGDGVVGGGALVEQAGVGDGDFVDGGGGVLGGVICGA